MRAPRLRGLLGATLAVGIAAAGVVLPATLTDGRRPLAPAEPEPPTCRLDAPCRPGPRELIDRVEAQLVARLPRRDDASYARLARTIVAESEAAHIDPLLVLALIEVESSFDPTARSEQDARGLMQLRPATLCREAERAGLSCADPHDPIVNVRAGVRYLRRLLDAFGREELALMAYNAGPNRILGYLREGEIPARFRVYPRRIGSELRRLRRTLGGAPAPALAERGAPVVAQ